jgi:quinohemoprotein ethanol dehydrogenase
MNSFKPIMLAVIGSFGANIASSGSSPADGRPPGDVTAVRLLNAESEPGAWLTPGRDYSQTYYSPLSRINAGNVAEVGFAWAHDIDFSAAFQATPIVVDGALYTSGNRGSVYALEADSGRLLWSFEPTIEAGLLSKHCCGGVNRGVAVWRGRVYVADLAGYLYALDATTGAVEWKVDAIADRSRAYSSTGAPYIANELVVIGNSGADFDARGYVTAYDAETGKLAWRFYTVPGNPDDGFEHPELAMAAETWDRDSRWDVGLGGTVWDGMAYDPELDLLYVGTGNGVPWNRDVRSPAGGDNLFLSCILALNAQTGRLVWFYQTVPGDSWDYTATQKLILADLEIDGRVRKSIMQAPKNGFFYVLDRETGQFLSAKPYATVTWASHVNPETGRPVETGQGDYSREPKLVFPGPLGAHQWQPMAYSKLTGLVYIPVQELPAVFFPPALDFEYNKAQVNLGANFTLVASDGGLPDTEGSEGLPPIEALRAGQPPTRPRALLRAWDPREQRLVWEVETTGAAGEDFQRPAGVMTSAGGLVFQGHADGHLRIHDARNGALLRSIDIGTSMLAAAMSYTDNGEQYVAIMAGVAERPGYADYKYGNKGRIVVLKLGGGRVPERAVVDRRGERNPARPLVPPVEDTGTPAQIQLGSTLYERYCAICHAYDRAPDLRNMNGKDHEEFLEIVLTGSRSARGMGDFSGFLSQEDAAAIHAFVINSAWRKYGPGQ